MNNYYILKHLVSEIQSEVTGLYFDWACTPRTDVLEIAYKSNGGETRLIIDVGRTSPAFFMDQYQPPPGSNTTFFFDELKGQSIERVELANRDRVISILFENDREIRIILYGSANVFYIDEGKIAEAFLNGEKWEGQSPPEPNPAPESRPLKPEMGTKQGMSQLNPLLPRNLLGRLISSQSLEFNDPSELEDFTSMVTMKLENEPEPRVLSTGEVCLWSKDILPDKDAETFNSVNECVRYAYYRRMKDEKNNAGRELLLDKLSSREKAIKKQLKDTSSPERHLERANEYEKKGHLLMANVHHNKYDHKELITVNDLYDNNSPLTIPLDPKLSLAGNADAYYEKASKARKTYEVSVKRHQVLEDEQKKLGNLIEQVQSLKEYREVLQWINNHTGELEEVGIKYRKEKQQLPPFRIIEVDGYEVWIGKNAKNNDRLTATAHKEDIWFHARGQPGSHVIIRMNNRKDYPDKKILIKVAAIAAYNSKARGAAMVPVSYTKKKYIRKPRNASPGTVVMDHEQVLMAEPHKF